MQSENEGVKAGTITISERTPEPEARQLMFAVSSTCHHCRKPIDTLEEARALLDLTRQLWLLLHQGECLVARLLPSPLSGRPFGISPRSYRRRFG